MVERVARIGDAWTIAGHATLATLERQVALYRAVARRGRQALSAAAPPSGIGAFYIARDMDTAPPNAMRRSRGSTTSTARNTWPRTSSACSAARSTAAGVELLKAQGMSEMVRANLMDQPEMALKMRLIEAPANQDEYAAAWNEVLAAS